MNWPPLGMVERRGDADLDAELIKAMRFAFAVAFDLGRIQQINSLASLVLALFAHTQRQHQR